MLFFSFCSPVLFVGCVSPRLSQQVNKNISVAVTCHLVACALHNPKLTELLLDHGPSDCVCCDAWLQAGLAVPPAETVREGWAAVLSFIESESGRQSEARTPFEELAADRFASVTREDSGLVVLVLSLFFPSVFGGGGGFGLRLRGGQVGAVAVLVDAVAAHLLGSGVDRGIAIVAVAPSDSPGEAVVVDIDIMRAAPQRYLNAGVGDVLSNLSAVADWELARDVIGEAEDGLASSMARTAAVSLLHHPGAGYDAGFLTTLAEGLVMSGLAMAVAGTTRPCSGACHEISHAIDRLFPAKSAPHGEQVGVGARFATFVRGDLVTLDAMTDSLRRRDLPLTPMDLGLTSGEFAAAVAFAPQTRPDRFTILEHLAMSEPEAADRVADFLRYPA